MHVARRSASLFSSHGRGLGPQDALINSSSLFAIRVVSFAYLRLLIFLLTVKFIKSESALVGARGQRWGGELGT